MNDKLPVPTELDAIERPQFDGFKKMAVACNLSRRGDRPGAMEADMNRTSCRALGIATALLACPAVAAGLPSAGPSPYVAAGPFGVYDWTGAHVGANLGYQRISVANLPLEPAGINGGAQAGYNRQTGQFVDGFETDIQVSSADDTFAAYQYSNPWFGTARGRAGIALSKVLLCTTAGLAYGGEKLNFVGAMQPHTDVGWTAGGGIEVGLTRNWSAKAEYSTSIARAELCVDHSQQRPVLRTDPPGGQLSALKPLQRFPFIVDHRPCVLRGEAL